MNNRASTWNQGGRAQHGWGNLNQEDRYLDPAMLNAMTPGQRRMYFIGREQVRQQNTSTQHCERENESRVVQAESRNDT